MCIFVVNDMSFFSKLDFLSHIFWTYWHGFSRKKKSFFLLLGWKHSPICSHRSRQFARLSWIANAGNGSPGQIFTQLARKFLKIQVKRLVKSNISISLKKFWNIFHQNIQNINWFILTFTSFFTKSQTHF